MRALVAYGSRYGSTEAVARAMCRQLEASGIEADVRDACDVDDLAPYDFAIVGSGIYVGLLRRRVVRLLHRIARQAPTLPIGVFALGPLVAAAERPEDWEAARTRLDATLARIDGLHLLDSAVFGGVIDRERMGFLFARAEEVDMRDWNVIERWVDELVRTVRRSGARLQPAAPVARPR